MKCPRCGSDVRPSQKTPGYYLCDTCRKRYPASAVIDDSHDDFFDTDDLDIDDIDMDTDLQESSGRSSKRSSGSSRSPSGRSKSRSSSSSSSHSGRGKKGSAKPVRSTAKNSRAESSPDRQRSNTRRSPARSSVSSAPAKKKGGGALKVLLILLLLLVIAGGVVFGLVHFNIIDNPLGKSKKEATTSQNDKDTDKKDPLTTYQIGETAEYNGIQVKAIGYEESSGDDWSAPAEGNVFVFVNMEITNNTEEELPVSSMASFESYCGEEKLDYSANAFTALATNTDRKQMDGSIASGDTLNGYLCLEVPSDWTTLTIHYANNVWSNDQVQFEIKK